MYNHYATYLNYLKLQYKERHDSYIQTQNEKELKTIQKLREKIDKYTKKAKEKQLEAEHEVKEH